MYLLILWKRMLELGPCSDWAWDLLNNHSCMKKSPSRFVTFSKNFIEMVVLQLNYDSKQMGSRHCSFLPGPLPAVRPLLPWNVWNQAANCRVLINITVYWGSDRRVPSPQVMKLAWTTFGSIVWSISNKYLNY